MFARFSLAASVLLIGCGSSSVPIRLKANHIVVSKSEHTMTLFAADQPLRTYKVALGRGRGNAKHRLGDHETPEGVYTIDARNAHSRFHRSLHISYPNAADLARARSEGFSSGNDIMIHGVEPQFAWLGHLQSSRDWTDGCIAVTNAEMDEIWDAVPTGTRIEIKH